MYTDPQDRVNEKGSHANKWKNKVCIWYIKFLNGAHYSTLFEEQDAYIMIIFYLCIEV